MYDNVFSNLSCTFLHIYYLQRSYVNVAAVFVSQFYKFTFFLVEYKSHIDATFIRFIIVSFGSFMLLFTVSTLSAQIRILNSNGATLFNFDVYNYLFESNIVYIVYLHVLIRVGQQNFKFLLYTLTCQQNGVVSIYLRIQGLLGLSRV